MSLSAAVVYIVLCVSVPQISAAVPRIHVISPVWMKEEFTVPTNGFVCEWKRFGVSIFMEIVGKNFHHRHSRWYRLASVYSVGARVKKKLLDSWWKSLEAG